MSLYRQKIQRKQVKIAEKQRKSVNKVLFTRQNSLFTNPDFVYKLNVFKMWFVYMLQGLFTRMFTPKPA